MEIPVAKLVLLKKVSGIAPDFHRHIASKQALGSVVQRGDRIMIYEVQATIPSERVIITEETRIEFC